jgi:hypothetical protein
VAAASIPVVRTETKERALVIAAERRISPVEIVEVTVATRAGQTLSVLETEPFSIRIKLQCSGNTPHFNVSLIIYRSDGVYMFWQPSDFHGAADTAGSGLIVVIFNFDKNYFSAGDYDITVNAMAHWHENMVQSEVEIFDRKLSATHFTIRRKYKSLQFGALNQRARIEIVKLDVDGGGAVSTQPESQ